MMRATSLIVSVFSLITFCSFGQSSSNYFSQGVFSIPDLDEVRTLETSIRNISNLNIVRLDHNTQRFFIVKSDAVNLSEDEVKSWFGQYGNTVTCIQIGVHGQDVVKRFPFTDCQ